MFWSSAVSGPNFNALILNHILQDPQWRVTNTTVTWRTWVFRLIQSWTSDFSLSAIQRALKLLFAYGLPEYIKSKQGHTQTSLTFYQHLHTGLHHKHHMQTQFICLAKFMLFIAKGVDQNNFLSSHYAG